MTAPKKGSLLRAFFLINEKNYGFNSFLTP